MGTRTLIRRDAKKAVKGNVEMISWRANRLKNDAKLYEIELLLKYMKDRKMRAWVL